MKIYITLLLTLVIISCSKEKRIVNDFLDCDSISENFKKYSGEKIDCQFHYRLAEFDGEDYIQLHAHCCDLIRSYVFNKDCIDICEVVDGVINPLCNEYLIGQETQEVLLIAKE